MSIYIYIYNFLLFFFPLSLSVKGAAVGRGSYLKTLLGGRDISKPKSDNEVDAKSNGCDDVSELMSLGIPSMRSSNEAKHSLNSPLPLLPQRRIT